MLKILNEDITQEEIDGTQRDEDSDELSDSNTEDNDLILTSQVDSALTTTSRVSHKLPAIDKRASNTVLKQKIKEISKDEANVSKGKVALLNKSDSTNRGFYSMMNDVKKRDLEFQIEKHEDDKELKREEY